MLRDLTQGVIKSFDTNRFEEDMMLFLGDVSDKQIPTRPITDGHVDLLQSIKEICVDKSSKRSISSWISLLKCHSKSFSNTDSLLAGTYTSYNSASECLLIFIFKLLLKRNIRWQDPFLWVQTLLAKKTVQEAWKLQSINITKRTVCLNLFLDDLSPLSGSTPLDCSGSGKHSLAGSIIYF